MNKKSKTERNRRIFTYNYKLKIDELIGKNTEKKKILPLKLNDINNINDKNDLTKNDSLSTLRKYLPSSKPYLFSNTMRKKMKHMKMIKNGILDTFYASTIKTTSARYQKNMLLDKYFKDDSRKNISKIKSLKLSINNDDSQNKYKYYDKGYKTINNSSPKNKKYEKHISNLKSIFFSNSKTNNSSLTTAALTSRNFFKKPKEVKLKLDINNNNSNDYDDSLGYNNIKIIEPTYTKRGIIRSFMDEVDKIRKDNYRNYYLKLHEFKQNILNENLLCQVQLDERAKRIAFYYLSKYSDGYNIYWYKLKKKINKEYDFNDTLKYKIKNLKTDISRLTLKIQKLLIKLSIFIEIKEFLLELKDFSSYPCGTSFNQLMELKNQLMEKIENNEEQTNLNIYLLNKKEIGIDLFIHKYKNSLIEQETQKDNKSFFSSSADFVEIPNKLDSNIKKLLWKKNILGKDIDCLKSSLAEMVEDSKYEQLYEKRIIQRYNIAIKNLAHLKVENENLNYKVESIKKTTKNDKYGKLNKNICVGIIKIFNNFLQNKYITEEDNYLLSKNSNSNNTIKYLLICLSIMEKNILDLLKFKKDVINKDPILKKTFELNRKYDAMNRKKIKEQNERLLKIKNTFDKLNKIKYYKEKKDYYDLNRIAYIQKEKRERTIAKEREIKRNKGPVEIMMDII